MRTFDWIVVGAGITGSALSYELNRVGFSVLLVEQNVQPHNATRYSYGGIPYWSGTTPAMQQLCREGIEQHRFLSEELGASTQFREIDLVLTIDTENEPQAIASLYANCMIPPKIADVGQACELEPLLNPNAISGALIAQHAHIDAQALAIAYQTAFRRNGGEIAHVQVQVLLQKQGRIQGISTAQGNFESANMAICAGGFSRALLKASDIHPRLYFTHAEILETAPVDITLRTLVMPAELQRSTLETEASSQAADALWEECDRPSHVLQTHSVDVGAIQFSDRHLNIGQLSRILTDPYAQVNAAASEAEIRAKVGNILPAIATLPAQWHHCLVAFSHDYLPLIGSLPHADNVHLFSGFTSPLIYVPPLAKRFAAFVSGNSDSIISSLSPQRFSTDKVNN